MNILWLTIPAALALVLLIIHCYWYRGLRVTLVFFVGCFLYSIFKENAIYFFEGVARNSYPPYEVLNLHIKIFNASLTVCVGWMFTLYLSWFLAERILKRIKLFNGKLFPTLAWGAMVAASISYCVEATGINAGWWHWTRSDTRLADFFVGTSLSPIEGWAFTFLVFLTPYFLIECSKYKERNWKYVFLLPSLLYVFFRLNSMYLTAIFFECIVVIFLIYLTLRSSLLLICHLRNKLIDNLTNIPYFIAKIPFFIVTFMIMVVIYVDFKNSGKAELLISKMPIIIITLLSIKRIPFFVTFLLVAIMVVLGGKIFLVPAIPVAFFLILLLFSRMYEKNANPG